MKWPATSSQQEVLNMRLIPVVALALLLVAAPVVAEQSALSIAAEFGVGTLAATVSFEWVLSLTFQAYPQARHLHSIDAGALGGASMSSWNSP